MSAGPSPSERKTPATHEFDADTRVRATGRHAYATTVTDRWSALGGGANGGYLLALCLQALRGDMPFPDPLTVSAFFLRRVAPGPAEIATELFELWDSAGRLVAQSRQLAVAAG